ncbi:LysR family transcriptional regulator [Streptomyces roseolus]|uniref:LysR family transcriptional regulator n=1 Tax=Streptomyces roseolus TaxID=67358 RepID=UPI0037B7CE25
MELRHLRHFLALAEEQSFTKAAARELIVQSGLSTSVRQLEREVGAELFIRGSRPVRLTAEGRALLPEAKRTLEAAAAARQAVQEVRGLLTGRLRIGSYPVSRDLVPVGDLLSRFAHAHPALEIHVRHTGGMDMARMVADGDLDCAFLDPLPGRATGLDILPVAAEPLLFACPVRHRLAARSSVTLGELVDERFIETDPAWTTRVRTDEAFAHAGLKRRVTCEVSDWWMVLELVAGGLGVALVPHSYHRTPLTGDDGPVRLVPLRGPRIERRTDLCLPCGLAAGPAARRFASYVRAWQESERTPAANAEVAPEQG